MLKGGAEEEEDSQGYPEGKGRERPCGRAGMKLHARKGTPKAEIVTGS